MIASSLQKYRKQNKPSPEITSLNDFLDAELIKAEKRFRAKGRQVIPATHSAQRFCEGNVAGNDGRECRHEKLVWETNRMRNVVKEVWPEYMRKKKRVEGRELDRLMDLRPDARIGVLLGRL